MSSLQNLFRLRDRPPRSARAARLRLHIGCGPRRLDGWVNVDSEPLPGVDEVLDIRGGLPFKDAEAIYAEHFLEHLTLDEGLAFLAECRRVLSHDGVLRVSTPNLDWVMATHYPFGSSSTEEKGLIDGLRINRAFHGWGHRFLYNHFTLTMALKATGFSTITYHRYGESNVSHLRGIEGHEKSEDTPELPHVLIVEAWGWSQLVPLPQNWTDEYRLEDSDCWLRLLSVARLAVAEGAVHDTADRYTANGWRWHLNAGRLTEERGNLAHARRYYLRAWWLGGGLRPLALAVLAYCPAPVRPRLKATLRRLTGVQRHRAPD